MTDSIQNEQTAEYADNKTPASPDTTLNSDFSVCLPIMIYSPTQQCHRELLKWEKIQQFKCKMLAAATTPTFIKSLLEIFFFLYPKTLKKKNILAYHS